MVLGIEVLGLTSAGAREQPLAKTFSRFVCMNGPS